MPFTFSHPAASVPLTRRGLVLSALVVGSMAPDFGYFFRFLPPSHFSHTLYGMFLCCIPTGLAVLWLFHTLLKRPALSLLPMSHQRRLIDVASGFSFGPLRRFALIVVSLALGALTHIAWDSFTHPHGWVVQRVPVLSLTIIETAQGSLRVYKVLQHGSTLVGAVLLWRWYVRWYRQAPPQLALPSSVFTTSTRLISVVSMGLGAVVVAVVYAFLAASSVSDLDSLRQFVGRTVVVSVSVLFVEFIVFSALWHLRELRVP